MEIALISRSIGSSRIRTQDLKKLRAESKKGVAVVVADPRRDAIAQFNNAHINLQESRQDQLPPEWVDTYEKIEEDMQRLQDKSKKQTVTKLKELQAERLSIVFGETKKKDKEIEVLLCETTTVREKVAD
jgi:hypothetical protein